MNLPSFENKDVLDVGCSDGFFSKFFSDTLNAKSVIGIDINKYDGGVAFDVLNSYKEDFEKKYDSHNDFPLLKDAYNELGLEDSNKFNFIKKIFNIENIFLNMEVFTI